MVPLQIFPSNIYDGSLRTGLEVDAETCIVERTFDTPW